MVFDISAQGGGLGPETLDLAVAFFVEHGWWASPPCLDERLLTGLERDIDRYYAGERDRRVSRSDGSPWAERTTGPLRRGNCLSLLMDGCRSFVMDPLLPSIAARLARTPEIRLLHDQVWYKEAGCSEAEMTTIGWHHDKSFWGGCSSENLISAWVPLADCTMEMGPLTFVDASHRSGSRDPGTAMAPMTLKRGQVSFHHCRTIHGSGPNCSADRRVAFCIHYQDETNARAAAGREPSPGLFLNALLRVTPDGTPDYLDPVVCPRLWPPASVESGESPAS